MKYKAITFIIILSIIFLSGCMVKESKATENSAPTTKNFDTNMPKDFFTEKESYAVKLLSEAAASAVWQYGKDLNWINEDGSTDLIITPRQLALSQRTCTQALIYWFWENPINSDLTDDKKEALYAQTLFPGIRLDELPMTDEFSNWSQGVNVFTKVDMASTLFSTASVDGKVGYVIVRIIYNNDNGEFENFYRVDWKIKEPFDMSSHFQYQLVGVRPMARFLLGGQPYEEFSKKYLDPTATKTLEKFGITHSIGHLEKRGAWGTENIILLKTISYQGTKEIATYILLDDCQERITYLGALDEATNAQSAQTQLLTVLQARNLLYEKHIDAELFYPAELDKWENNARCYGFVYNDGYKSHYVWVNSLTHKIDFADEIKDYTNR